MFDNEDDGNQFTQDNVEDRASDNNLTEQTVPSVSDVTSLINKELFDLQEEEFSSQLQTLLPDFKISETGKFFPFDEVTRNDPRANQRLGLANFVEIEAPNGEKLLLETAISSTSRKVKKDLGEKDLERYYLDLQRDLKDFVETNSSDSIQAKQKFEQDKLNRRKLFKGYQEAIQPNQDEINEINVEFPDISIFNTFEKQKVVGVGRSGAGMDVKFPAGQERVVMETIQPYQIELKQAKSELGSDTAETEVKERALQILRENAADKIKQNKTKEYQDQLQEGEIPPQLEEEFANFTSDKYTAAAGDNLKSYVTVGAKEYSEDLVAIMNGTIESRNKLEDIESQLQAIIDKKTYSKQDIADYERIYKDYEQQVSDYNATLELYSDFATTDIKEVANQLNLLQKNYDFWEKQSISVALNFRDFAARANYGLSSFIGADGKLPDKNNPEITREEARTLELQEIITQSNIIKSGYEDDVAFENAFKSPEKFMKWSVNMANTQLPILTSLAVPGGWSALLANSFGENYSQMTLEDMKAKAASKDFGIDYEAKSTFNKWGTSLLYAAPEVILDRLTTGVRVRGVMDMFKTGGDELVDITAKEILTDVAYGIPTDATMGALSEGTTQIWQNWITGKDDLTEGFAEAAFSGLIMDGSLSTMPTLKAAAVMQFTDQNKLKEIRDLQSQIDQLYTLQSSAFGSDLKQDIKDLEAQRDEKIREVEDSVIGIKGRGLSEGVVKEYVKLTSEKAKLKNRAKQILDNNLLSDEQKQKQLAPLKAQYDVINQVQEQYRNEKGSEFNMFAANLKNKQAVDKLYNDAKARLVEKGNANPTELQIRSEARVAYNNDLIEANLANIKKNKLDDKLLVVRSEGEIDNIENETVRAIVKDAYNRGDYGLDVQNAGEGKNTVIFVENMAQDDRLEVRTHELGHNVMKQAFDNDPAIFNGMANTIVEWAKANDKELYNRLERQVERDSNNVFIADEVIANFFEEVAANRVKLKSEKNRGLLSIFTFGANKAMKDKYGVDFNIAGVEDSFALMYGLAKKIKKGTLTQEDIKGLSESETIKALQEQGKQIQEQYLFATQEQAVKMASKVQTKIDDLGNKYTREQWQQFGADETIAEIYDDLAALVGSKAFMLERLPNFSKEDFITDAIGELIPHIRNFNIDRKKDDSDKFGLSGWINSQLMNKIGNVLKKKTATSETFTVDEDAETFREQVETADDLATFEEEDLSLQAQLRQRQRAEELAERGEQEGVEYSEFRRQLEFNGQKGISDSMKRAIEKITLEVLTSSKYINLNIDAIEKTLQRDFEVAIKKSIQDAMGGQADYTEFLAKNKDAILKYMDISSLVAIERQVPAEDKILTQFVRRLTTQQDIQDAIDNGWLSHIDNPAQGPNLYKVLNPSTSEFLKFYNPPLRVDSPKKVKQWDAMPDAQKQTLADNMGISLDQARARFVEVRSGLKGTRKDTLAERIAGQLAFDATMQVIQSPKFVSLRETAGLPIVSLAKIKEIARKIDRGIEVKFAGSNVVKPEISIAYRLTEVADGNLNSEKLRILYRYENDKKIYFVARGSSIFDRIKKEFSITSDNTFQKSLGIAYEVMASDFFRGQRIVDPTTRKTVYLQALADRIANVKSSPNTIFEQLSIDDVYPFGKPNGIRIQKKATEKDDVPDIYFSFGPKKDGIGFGIEIKMGLSRGSSISLRPFKDKNGKWYFVNDKQNKANETENEPWSYDFFSKEDKAAIDGILAEAAQILNAFEAKHEIDIDFEKGITQEDYNTIFKEKGYTKTHYSIIGKHSLSPSITGALYANKKIISGLISIEGRGVFVLPTGKMSSKDKTPKAASITTQVVKEFKRLTGKDIPFFTTQLDTRLEFRTGNVRTKDGPYKGTRPITFRLEQAIDNNNIDKSNISLDKDGEMITKAIANVLKAQKKAKVGKSSDKAINAARLINANTEPVGMSAFDFDETLIIDGENFVVATKGEDVVKISSGNWPIDGPRLAEEGYKFDFSDFVNVRGGVDGPLMKDFKKKLAKYGAKNMFILTARPQEADKAIHGWLKSKGINIPLDNITGLGNSTGDAKAQWMLDKFAEGYNDMYFVDDALPNVEAVQNVFDQLDVKGKSVRAVPGITKQKIKFSKAALSITVNSPQYKKFKNSIKDRVLYHGGSETINTIRDNNAVWFYLDDAEAAQDWGDGEVYSVKASDIQDMVVVPDLNDVSAFTTHVRKKFNLKEEIYDIREILKHPKADEILAEWMDWSSKNDMEYDLGYNLYEKGKVTSGAAVTVLGVIPKDKIQQISPKFSKGSLRGNKAVKHVLSQLDIKSDVQQAKIKFSKNMSSTINEMIERSRGIPTEEVISRAISKRRGKNKNKFQIFIPPSAEDFIGLMYYIIGDGKQGEADLDFFKKSLVDPFSRAYTELDAARQTILNDLDKLNKNYREVYKKLGDTMPNSEFTFDNAIRVYLFNKHGHTVPGVTSEEVANLVGRVNADMELLVYAETLDMLSKTDEYVEPGEAWTAGSIAGDINRVVEGIHRKTFLGEWIENKNEIFSEENLNKLEAAYGTSYRGALEDMLYRMETGISRPTGANRITNQWTNWLNNSVGAIMFFNTKSALLQTISTVNYLNFEDNNVFTAAKAFANQKQYWADFAFIFNSDFLKQRRAGLKTDVSQSEIASAVAGATNKAKAAIAYLLKIGFAPTQAADSFAISAGGATFYRNRLNKYLAEGKTQKEAQEQAFIDFREITEESQQSARPDRVSQQQTTNAGRLILAFQNAPMQFNRIIKKAALDLINKRGDWRANTSRVIYYGGVQSLIFLALQNALFALVFDDEDENKDLTVKELQKKEKFQQTKYDRIVNGMVDTLLRGSGITGAVISTLKNTVLKFMSEAEKGKRMNEASILTEALQISPQIGSKARKILSGVRTYKWDGEAIPLMSKLNTRNPLWVATAPVVEGLTNVPMNRLITKVNNLREAANSNNEVWQRAGVALGWSAWDLGVDAGAEVDELIKEEKKKKQAKKGRCAAITSAGTQCKNTTTGKSRFCYAHD